MSEEAKTTIVAIGNPGAGKSTLGNLIAGRPVFRAGLSVDGRGITTVCADQNVSETYDFVDTVGIAERDPRLRAEASAQLTAALRKDQNVKMLFFITLQAGRVVAQDVETMSLTLQAVERDLAENAYGVVVNKVPGALLDIWKNDPDSRAQVIASLRAAMPPGKTTFHILFNPHVAALECQNNPVVPENQAFIDFIDSVPMLKIHKEHVEDIVHDHERLEELANLIKDREKEITENRSEMERLKNMQPTSGILDTLVQVGLPALGALVMGPLGALAGAGAVAAISGAKRQRTG